MNKQEDSCKYSYYGLRATAVPQRFHNISAGAAPNQPGLDFKTRLEAETRRRNSYARLGTGLLSNPAVSDML